MIHSKPTATTADAVVDFFAKATLLKGEELSVTKLTKLAYYAYAWFLYETENRARLFDHSEIRAMALGPVPLGAWKRARKLKALESLNELDFVSFPWSGIANQQVTSFLQGIEEEYGHYSKYELVSFSHNIDAWYNRCELHRSPESFLEDDEIVSGLESQLHLATV